MRRSDRAPTTPNAFTRRRSIECAARVKRRRTPCSVLARAIAQFGEAGMVDLIGINGYYAMLAMVMNAARTRL